MVARRTALVTAGAAGIGRATAMRLSADGMNVIVIDRDRPGLESLARDFAAAGNELTVYLADLGDPDAVHSVFRRLKGDGHGVDVLVNNAGRSARARARRFTESDLSSLRPMFAINLQCAIIASRLVIDAMREAGWGRIINIASEAAFTGGPTSWDYGAAKAGLIGFTRSLASDVANAGITVNAIGPGLIRTAAFEEIHASSRERALARIPMGVPGRPEDVAGVVAFFAGDDSRYVTGQTLLVNGGSWFV